MNPFRRIIVRSAPSGYSQISYEVASFQFAPHTWQPAINAYRCEKCVTICAELAGVDQETIELTVEPQRVVIRGRRDVPEPSAAHGRALQMLAMEIDYGAFERAFELSDEVEAEEARVEFRDGLLWIHLPLRS